MNVLWLILQSPHWLQLIWSFIKHSNERNLFFMHNCAKILEKLSEKLSLQLFFPILYYDLQISLLLSEWVIADRGKNYICSA